MGTHSYTKFNAGILIFHTALVQCICVAIFILWLDWLLTCIHRSSQVISNLNSVIGKITDSGCIAMDDPIIASVLSLQLQNLCYWSRYVLLHWWGIRQRELAGGAHYKSKRRQIYDPETRSIRSYGQILPYKVYYIPLNVCNLTILSNGSGSWLGAEELLNTSELVLTANSLAKRRMLTALCMWCRGERESTRKDCTLCMWKFRSAEPRIWMFPIIQVWFLGFPRK